MPKYVAEYHPTLSIFKLKKWGFLSQRRHAKQGVITWTFMDEKQEAAITSYCNIKESFFRNDTVELKYFVPSWNKHITLVVYLVKTKCHYGGNRYWFQCGGINGEYCGRRVGVIYKIGWSFMCRKCGNLNYASQHMNGTYKRTAYNKPDIDNFAKTIKRSYYAGKPTRKFKRLLTMQERFDRSFTQFFAER